MLADTPSSVPPTDKAAVDQSVVDALAAARSITKNVRFAFLATIDEKGYPHSRMVDPNEPEADFALVRMGTNKLTRKVAHLAKRPQASLAYYDKEGIGYVQIVGDVVVDGSAHALQKAWKSEWMMFYRDPPTCPHHRPSHARAYHSRFMTCRTHH